MKIVTIDDAMSVFDDFMCGEVDEDGTDTFLEMLKEKAIPSADKTEQWQELKETITEMRDNDGTGTQQDACRFLVNYMDVLEKQMQEPKTGHWIYDRTRDWDGECKYECSCCGMGSDVDYAYCMRCGARMVEPREKT